MASLSLTLQLLLVSGVSAYRHYHDYYGGSVSFTPKGQNPDGTYVVELRNKQTNFYCTENGFRCVSGDCGSQSQTSTTTISQNSLQYHWCHREVVSRRSLHGNQPFEIRYPTSSNWYYGIGFWHPNSRSSRAAWSMEAHIDLGTRSDTGEANRSPTTSSFPPLRTTQNCPRKYSLPVFDHDGDRVRCRFASPEASECSLCYQPEGFSLDQNSCTLSYTYTGTIGGAAFELMVEDFPTEHITVSYSDGSYTIKNPFTGRRRRRDISTDTTAPSGPFSTGATTAAAPATAPATAADEEVTTATSPPAAITTSAETTTSTGSPATSSPATTTTAATSTSATTTTAATTTPATSSPATTTTSATTTTAATTTPATSSPATTTAATSSPATTTTSATTSPATTTTTTAATTTPATSSPATSSPATSSLETTTTAATSSPATTPATSSPATSSLETTTTAATSSPATTPATSSPATSSPATTPATSSPATSSPATTTPATSSPATSSPASTATSSPATATTAATSSTTTTTTATSSPATTTTATSSPATTTDAAPATDEATTAATVISSTSSPAATTTAAPLTTTTTTTAAPPTTTTTKITTTTTTTTTTTAATTTTAQPTTTTLRPTTRRYQPSIPPLSRLPLQFYLYVSPHHAPSCLEGDYIPIFLPPTPRNGVNLLAFVNQTLEIKVRASARYTSIHQLVVGGPAGTSTLRTSTEEFTIKWTPTENEVNDHFVFCFVFESTDRYNRIFQTDLRCVTADVGHYDTTVHCSRTTMKVEVEKSYLIRRNERNLHLRDFTDAECSLTRYSNRTHLVAIMSLNTCGTTLEEDGDNLIFRNEITSADPNEVISRQHDVEVVFSCVYPKHINLTLGYKHKNPYAFIEKGFGAFTFQFEFFESQRFRTQVNASTYPVEVNLKQMMFMQIEATTSIPNTVLFVESCKATPYDNPNSRVSYTIIEHGCVRDNTVQVFPSSRTQFRFAMEAFEFIGAYAEVYVTCSVILCEADFLGTRCSQGCIPSGSGSHRGKREAVAETSRHSISQGPLHLARISDSQVSVPSLNLGVNILLIASCLLACGGVVYNSRRSKTKYQPLPNNETGRGQKMLFDPK